MKILALDLGKFNSVCGLFDAKTRKHRFLTTPTQREYLAATFADTQADLVVMKACGPSGWINDLAIRRVGRAAETDILDDCAGVGSMLMLGERTLVARGI